MAGYDIAVIGGDARTAYMAEHLVKKGYRVIVYGGRLRDLESKGQIAQADSLEEAVFGSDMAAGGVPFAVGNKIVGETASDLTLTELSRYLRKGQKVFGGKLPEFFVCQCEERGIECFDYMKNEKLAVLNAIATAEGAVMRAVCLKETNLHNSRTLVIGYGRCGKILCQKLKGFGACVTVVNRREQPLAEAYANGFDVMTFADAEKKYSEFEYIFNTVPAVVLGRKQLEKMRKDVLIIDLASGNGGVDHKAAEELGVRAVQESGLPGRYAPESSGVFLAEYVAGKAGLCS